MELTTIPVTDIDESTDETSEFDDINQTCLREYINILTRNIQNIIKNEDLQITTLDDRKLDNNERIRCKLINCKMNGECRDINIFRTSTIKNTTSMDYINEPGINRYNTLPTTWNGSNFDFYFQIGLMNYIHSTMLYQHCKNYNFRILDLQDYIMQFLITNNTVYYVERLDMKPFIQTKVYEGMRFKHTLKILRNNWFNRNLHKRFKIIITADNIIKIVLKKKYTVSDDKSTTLLEYVTSIGLSIRPFLNLAINIRNTSIYKDFKLLRNRGIRKDDDIINSIYQPAPWSSPLIEPHFELTVSTSEFNSVIKKNKKRLKIKIPRRKVVNKKNKNVNDITLVQSETEPIVGLDKETKTEKLIRLRKEKNIRNKYKLKREKEILRKTMEAPSPQIPTRRYRTIPSNNQNFKISITFQSTTIETHIYHHQLSRKTTTKSSYGKNYKVATFISYGGDTIKQNEGVDYNINDLLYTPGLVRNGDHRYIYYEISRFTNNNLARMDMPIGGGLSIIIPSEPIYLPLYQPYHFKHLICNYCKGPHMTRYCNLKLKHEIQKATTADYTGKILDDTTSNKKIQTTDLICAHHYSCLLHNIGDGDIDEIIDLGKSIIRNEITKHETAETTKISLNEIINLSKLIGQDQGFKIVKYNNSSQYSDIKKLELKFENSCDKNKFTYMNEPHDTNNYEQIIEYYELTRPMIMEKLNENETCLFGIDLNTSEEESKDDREMIIERKLNRKNTNNI